MKDIGIDRIIVSGEKMTLKNGDQEVATYTFEVVPQITSRRGLLWKKKTKEGTGLHPTIYEIDGTKLKLCFPLLSTGEAQGSPEASQELRYQGQASGVSSLPSARSNDANQTLEPTAGALAAS